MCEILCKECRESDPNERYGHKIYCDLYKMYVNPNDTCSHSVRRGYYVSSVICELLGKDENDRIYKTIRSFNIGYMKVNGKKSDFFKKYDDIGPKIATALALDNDQVFIRNLYDKYLVNVANLISACMYENAIKMYQMMLDDLVKCYGLENIDDEYNKGVIFADEAKDNDKLLFINICKEG